MPERCRVVAYQNQLDRTALARGVKKDDLYLSGSKVTIPNRAGVKGTSGNEFVFDSAFGPDTLPKSVARTAVPAAVDSVLGGLNHVLLVLGASGSGKAEMLEGTSAAGSEDGRWEGLVEHLIKALYVGVREVLERSPTGSVFRLQLQFLHIVEERVQDLLEPDCHTHDLELMDDEETGTLVRDAEPEELKGEAHAIGLYRGGIQSLRSLARYHEVDIDAACSVLTLTLTQRVPINARDDPSGAAFLSKRASVSVVNLPGTEWLREPSDAYELQVRIR